MTRSRNRVLVALQADAQAEERAYTHFLEVARERGTEEAMHFAAEHLPKDFCKHFSQLRKAADFVRRKGPPAKARHEIRGDATSERTGDVTLKVCGKCVRRLHKKGGNFDTLRSLADLAEAMPSIAAVEETGCMKQCKLGPNVQVLRSGDVGPHTVVVEGMSQEEASHGCFHGVANAAEAARVLKLASPSTVGEAAPPAQAEQDQVRGSDHVGGGSIAIDARQQIALGMGTVSLQEKERRARVRASIVSRVDEITAGLRCSEDDDEL